jgi:hypothetical protein
MGGAEVTARTHGSRVPVQILTYRSCRYVANKRLYAKFEHVAGATRRI